MHVYTTLNRYNMCTSDMHVPCYYNTDWNTPVGPHGSTSKAMTIDDEIPLPPKTKKQKRM